jgi:hypothetical protein
MGGREPDSRRDVPRSCLGRVHAGTRALYRGDPSSGPRRTLSMLQVGILGASFIAVLVLFIVPITLLGTISPFAIRLSVDDTSRAGQVSGQIYAISTLGSFIGTFLPTLVTIPAIGTTRTFLLFSLSCSSSRWQVWENSPAAERCSSIFGCRSCLQSSPWSRPTIAQEQRRAGV